MIMRLEKKLEIVSRIEAGEGVSAKEQVKNPWPCHSHEKGGLRGISLYTSLDLMLKLPSSKRGPLTDAHRIDVVDKD